ncbi:MAG: (d)CMP kinase [Lachnospiraceae bacterium]|nr:(d)CMP kinase [Lachnospiraceae bacterium]
MKYNIAIDGPAGAGKSTIAKKLAEKLGFVYIDTGAMYRAMAYYYMSKRIDIDDKEAVIAEFDNINIELKYIDGVQHIYLNKEDVSSLIRTAEVGENASKVSAIAEVRKKLVALQQEIARSINVVMDGRDIASVVLPDADLKIYLTASVEVRAQRRYKERIEKGEEADLAAIEEEIRQRDYRDMHRDASPLVCVPEAVVVDTSEMSIDEVLEHIISLTEFTE